MKAKRFTVSLLFLAAAITANAARVGVNYQVPSDVVASGGEAMGGASNSAPINIAGQAAVGGASSASYRNYAGFVPSEPQAGPPTSQVEPFAAGVLTVAVFDVAYTASAPGSGVQHVELFYRRNGGAWTQYGGQYTASPVSFDSSATGGDGYYELYTIATDNDNNREAAPATADAAVSVITYLAGSRIYVDGSVLASGDGSSWAQAKKTIGEAVALAGAGDHIWVANGVYPEVFYMKSSLAIFGGFAGGETDWSERDVAANVATIDANGNNGAVIFQFVNYSTIDGFTITGGRSHNLYCTGLTVDDTVAIANCTVAGGGTFYGIYCSHDATPTVFNCTFTDNSEGVNVSIRAHPTFYNCTITSNSSAGVYCNTASVDLIDCTVTSNSLMGINTVNPTTSTIERCLIAWNGTAGGFNCNFGASPTVIDCDISYNAQLGIECRAGSEPNFVGCRIVGNGYFGMFVYQSAPSFTDCTISENASNGVNYNDGAGASFTRCMISSNGHDGVVCWKSSPTIIDCAIDNNAHDGLHCSNNANPTISGTSISGNQEFGVRLLSTAALQLANCEINNNGLQGVNCGAGSSATLTDCDIIGPHAQGGVHCTQSSPTLVRCRIIGSMGNGFSAVGFPFGGLATSPTLESCLIAGSALFGVSCTYSEPTLINCIVSGSGREGIYASTDSSPHLINCTVDSNRNGMACWQSGPASVTNTILSNNALSGFYRLNVPVETPVSHCLFDGNLDSDYNDNAAAFYNGADEINANAPGAVGNVDGDPLYTFGPAGAWTVSPLYDPTTSRTTLVDASASFTPGALVGQLINPNSSQTIQALITANGTDTIEVLGDVTGFVANGDPYQLIDYHIQAGSAAIGFADLAVAPAEDFEGDPRPGDDALADIGADEYAGPPFDSNPPTSELASPPSVTSPAFEVTYTAQDAESGVAYVEVWYSHDGGPWTQYPGQFTASPILFDTNQTGGDGEYALYSLAVDNAANREAPPAVPDAVTTVNTAVPFERIYVDADATGDNSGRTWDNATTSIAAAVQLADTLSISEIWVAEGTYTETVTMASGVSVYGGFRGEETMLSERDWTTYVTVIRGDRYGVVMDEITGARLDGFTVTTNGSVSSIGMECWFVAETVEVANCTFADSSFGAHLFGGSAMKLSGCLIINNGTGVSCMSPAIFSGCSILDNRSGMMITVDSSATLTDCVISGSEVEGVWLRRNASPTFRDCMITGNGNSGVLCDDSASATLTDCVIVGNGYADVGTAGVYCKNSSSSHLNGCIVSGNSGSGLWFDGNLTGCSLVNCQITGNIGRGVVLWRNTTLDPAPATILNCTVSDNKDEGILATRLRDEVAIANTLISRNGSYGMSGSSDFSTPPVLINCLFFANEGGDYYDDSEIYSGGSEINLNVPGASGNVSGDPLFLMGPTGTWTAEPVYDENTNRTTLTDGAASFVPDALVGRLITVDINSHTRLQALITANTATTIQVVGDAILSLWPQQIYQLVNYHLQDGSAALDRGDLAFAPPLDFDGDPRPGTDGLVDIGADEAEGSFIPPADEIAPVSVASSPPFVAAPMFDIDYEASDELGDVAYVELHYRHNQGAWVRYQGEYTASPIEFDTSLTGGDGFYEFYTIAMDEAGNRESAPKSPDAWTAVVTGFKGGRIYVDADATGSRSGEEWSNAFHRIDTAVLVAEIYRVSEIWVAEGVYNGTVTMASGVSVYGGFTGEETMLSERDWTTYVTVIRGDRYGVMMDAITDARLDGFTVTTDGSISSAGIKFLSAADTVEVANCTFADSSEGASVDGGSSVTFTGCVMINNQVGIRDSSSATFLKCSVLENRSGVIITVDSSATLTDCIISGSEWQGVWLRRNASPTLIDCTIAGNRDGGLRVEDSASPHLTGCIVSGNWDSGLRCDGNLAGCSLVNCQITGNIGRGVYLQRFGTGDRAPATIINCTVSDNRTQGIATSVFEDEVVIANTLISGNSSYGISGPSGYSAQLVLSKCLFFANEGGDYFRSPDIYIGGDEINRNVPGASGNVSGDPLFLMGPTGTWTAQPVYDENTNRTTLTDDSASFVPGEWVGRLIIVDVNHHLRQQALITSNTATSIQVVGEVYRQQANYQLVDYHLQAGSAALDRANPDYAPANDIEGDPRPGTDGLVDIGVDELTVLRQTLTLTWSPHVYPENAYTVDKFGVQDVIPPEDARGAVLFNLNTTSFLVSTLEALKNTAGSGWWSGDFVPNFPDEWEQPEINAWRLMTMTPDNVSLTGTSVQGLAEIAGILADFGLIDDVGDLLGAILGISRYEEILPTATATSAVIEEVVKMHPNSPPDGTLPVTLEDTFNDMETLAPRFGPASGHPGFIDVSRGLPHAEVLGADFAVTVTATSNLHWLEGVNLETGKEDIAFNVDQTGPTFDDPLEYDFGDPNALAASGVISDAALDLDFAIFEDDAWIAAGDDRFPLPTGNSPAWSLDPWTLEYVVAVAELLNHVDRRDVLLYEDPIFTIDEMEIAIGSEGSHFPVLDPNPAGWMRVWTLFNVGDPVAPQYLWDMTLEIAEQRLLDGGVAQGDGDIRIPLKNLPVGLTNEEMTDAIRPLFESRTDELSHLLLGDFQQQSGGMDFYLAMGTNGNLYLFFVHPDDPVPTGTATHANPGFFADSALTVRVSTTADGGSGDAVHEKLAITDQVQSVYCQDTAGNLYWLEIGPANGNSVDVTYQRLASQTVPTPAGGNVTINLLDGSTSLTFENVDTAGDTTITRSPDGPEAPSGFLIMGEYYSISTTAVFSGTVEICFSYDDSGLTPEDEAALVVLHYETDHWVDATSFRDPVANVLCARVTHFSEFAIALPVQVSDPNAFVTGGGRLGSGGVVSGKLAQQSANFGFNVRYGNGLPQGHLTFNDNARRVRLRTEQIQDLFIAGNVAEFQGRAAVNGEAGCWFVARAVDGDILGDDADEFSIKIWLPGVDPRTAPFYEVSGAISGGSIVLHHH